MFKLVGIGDLWYTIKVTHGMDVSPQPNAYHCHADGCSFDEIFTEVNVDVRLPTKEELNLYRKYTR